MVAVLGYERNEGASEQEAMALFDQAVRIYDVNAPDNLRASTAAEKLLVDAMEIAPWLAGPPIFLLRLLCAEVHDDEGLERIDELVSRLGA